MTNWQRCETCGEVYSNPKFHKCKKTVSVTGGASHYVVAEKPSHKRLLVISIIALSLAVLATVIIMKGGAL